MPSQVFFSISNQLNETGNAEDKLSDEIATEVPQFREIKGSRSRHEKGRLQGLGHLLDSAAH